MGDTGSIAWITAAYSGAVGLVGVLAAYLLRRRSVRMATITVAAVAVGVFVAGLVGTSRAMFISDHDFGVATEVSFVAGVIALGFGILVGETLARQSRSLQRRARAFGDSGTFRRQGGGGPAELSDLADELERTSGRLQASRERAQRLETSRRELVAWVSHDLRTPLAGLRAMSEALEDGMVEQPARYHAQIRSEVERMSRMVDDLFELSRIHAGAFEVSLEQVALGDLVSEAIAGVDPIARARGVRLGGSVDGEVLVRVDPEGMSRVLLNLLTNAVRHTPVDGSVEITGRAGTDGIEVAVSDACGGIPDDELGRVFDVAWRGTPARSPGGSVTRGGTGAGLGLAIVKGIVEAHMGSVAVHN
ncbi:MAG: HAMP domain-containing histidine kinase, partial [Actinomycetota bacterium]|nr:HAMP domain-containing histidine kinase [Actinomycetota bacterium]